MHLVRVIQKGNTDKLKLEQNIRDAQQRQLEELKNSNSSQDDKIKELEQKLQSKLAEKARLAAVEASKKSVVEKVVAAVVPAAQAAPGSSHEDLLAQAGISQSDWGYATYIINHENGLWCPTRSFGETSCIGANVKVAYGICQANPGTKMVSAGADWQTNIVTQLKWCNGYAVSRYGGWYGAYMFWLSHKAW